MPHLTPDEVERKYVQGCGAQLGGVFSRLVAECASVHFKWGDYVELFGSSVERVDLLNKAAGPFFRRVQDCLWEDILLHLARLVDSPRSGGKDNLTLQRLPPLVAPQLQPAVSDLVAASVKHCAFARDWRMRRIAHRDLALVLRLGAEPLAAASRRAVREALGAIAAALNAVEQHYLNSEVIYGKGGSNGALQLLYVLRDGLEAQDERRARMESGKIEPRDIGPPRAV